MSNDDIEYALTCLRAYKESKMEVTLLIAKLAYDIELCEYKIAEEDYKCGVDVKKVFSELRSKHYNVDERHQHLIPLMYKHYIAPSGGEVEWFIHEMETFKVVHLKLKALYEKIRYHFNNIV